MIRMPWVLLGGWFRGTVLGWLILVAGVAVIVTLVALVGTVNLSVWERATHVPRWYAVVVGCSLPYYFLPLYVASGRTRRKFSADAAVFTVVFPAFCAALVTAGFLLETGVYRLAGWAQPIIGVHLFASPLDVPMVFLEFWLVLAVWLAAGTMIAAGFYRNRGLGLALIPVGVALVAAVEIGVGPRTFTNFPPLWDIEFPASPLAAALACLAALIVAAAITWPVVHDVPLRAKTP